MTLPQRTPFTAADFIKLARTMGAVQVNYTLAQYAKDYGKPCGQGAAYLSWCAAVLHWQLADFVQSLDGAQTPG